MAEEIVPVSAVGTAPSHLILAYYEHLSEVRAAPPNACYDRGELSALVEASSKPTVPRGKARTNEISNVAVLASISHSPLSVVPRAPASPLETAAALARALQYDESYTYFWGHTGASWVPNAPTVVVPSVAMPAVSPIVPGARSAGTGKFQRRDASSR